ncbi:MAG: IclR family transcriptional regulator [Rhizobiales bacterium]|nr:IclR family transcriptional regulator [Hyphomicrobiales bacterium]
MSARPLSTALKCFDLLDTLADLPGPIRLSQLAQKTGETRATSYQRLLTLTTAGWVDRLPDGTYRLSMRACRIANAALEQAGFGDRALPILEDLTVTTGETSSLVVLENDMVVIAQRVESRGVLRADLRLGAEMSFSESASGQIWSAFGPGDLRKRLAKKGIKTASAKILKAVKSNQISVAGGGETLQGIAVVAVPVFGPTGDCLASLSLVGPDTRFEVEKLIPPLRAAASKLSNLQAR